MGWYPEADLVAATVSETQNEVIFSVTWAGNNQDDVTQPQDFFYMWYDFTFDLRGVETVGRFQRFLWEDTGEFDYFLLGTPDEERFGGMRIHAGWPAERTAPDTMTVAFPKQFFIDADFVPLRQGDHLKDLRLVARNDDFGFPSVPLAACPHLYPSSPPFASPGFCEFQVRDELTGLDDLDIALQPEGVGHLMMRSDRPWRLSNGLATTYLFEVDVHNFDDEADDVAFSATDVPKGWEVLHPAKVTFAGKEKTTIPVAVTVPFAHQHGAVVTVRLEAASDKNPSIEVGTELGIIYADPAQPGGHHPTLQFHAVSFGSFAERLWMNTASYRDPEERDRATGRYSGQDVEVGTVSIQGLPTEAHWTWNAFLSPGLQMGLDFALDQPVVADLAFEVGSGITATPSAMLMLSTREGDIPLAELTGDEMTIEPGTIADVTLTGMPLPAADRMEAGKGNLHLQIRLDGVPQPEESARQVLGTQASLVLDESSLTLPLLDFHEEVDLDGLELNAYTLGGNRTFAEVNPDKAVAFVFNVTNLLSQKETIDWALSGKHAEWARVLPDQTLIDGGGVGRVVVEVIPPASASEGDVAELLLMGTDSEERQVFIRMTAAVVTDEEIADESGVAQEVAKDVTKQNENLKKDSPGFEALALVALLAAIAVLLRRRER